MRGIFRDKNHCDDENSKNLLRNNIVSVPHFQDIYFLDSIWRDGPTENRSYKFSIHSFIFLDCLIFTGHGREVADYVREWERECSTELGEFPWHDHATALRLDRLSHMAMALPNCRFPELAARHASMLMREEFYSRRTNHGFDQSVSLIIASIAFRDRQEAPRWREVGLTRLKDEIAFAFTSEGVHVENSPGYHAGMIENLCRAKAVVEAIGRPFDIDIEALGDGAMRFLAWMTRPDRFLVYLGDTTQRRGAVPDLFSGMAAYPELQYALTGGAFGSPPDTTVRVFEKSGYAAYRSRWRPWANHVHIVMKCGHLSQYHRHDDDLTILVHAHGEDWLIDSGLYSHDQRDPVRRYMRSPLAHNVPFFPGLEPKRAAPGAAPPSLRELPGADRAMGVRAETRMYPGIRAVRDLLVHEPSRFRIRDSFQKSDPSGKSFWLFHVPADKKISVSTTSARILGRRHQLVIRTRHSGDDASFTVRRGLNDDFPSVFSSKMNEKSDTQVIVYGPSATLEISFTFEFTAYTGSK